jgi:hypothetical protein
MSYNLTSRLDRFRFESAVVERTQVVVHRPHHEVDLIFSGIDIPELDLDWQSILCS